ncbi:DHS-like NAD/FAD-binding domain-containing protein [Armillaria borealis]|uniref:DHS-like NAD/FAD-binding domain-containing protein n=1 Tax=Armillaria borealis TaxID=47425 RepID=A0AA39IUL9_9AGAR|nr:DHS-like NAD/FAD-binding domain-containing protein [Armillaria borealis]
MSSNIEEFRQVLSSSKKIIILSGAGLSVASGIPTFRGTGGLWRKYDAASLATPSAFAENQARVWQFFHYRREQVLNATPNAAHFVIARLAIPRIRQSISPNSKFTHITQNIDGLCVRALKETMKDLQETDVPYPIEMHGRLFDVVCTAHDCDFHETDYSSPICPALKGTELIIEAGGPEPVVRRSDLPRCPKCGQLCRPGVVWFGERPHHIHEIMQLADEADLCIIVGTSAIVQPASKIGGRVKAHGGKVALFNVELGNHADEADFVFLGPCEERFVEVFGI